jgi:hypothetical protein
VELNSVFEYIIPLVDVVPVYFHKICCIAACVSGHDNCAEPMAGRFKNE